MALTKQAIAERILEELGFPKNQSVDITESLLESIPEKNPATIPKLPKHGKCVLNPTGRL